MENDSVKHRFGLFLSIIPIPIFLFLAIFFQLTGHENSIVFDPPGLLPVLNLLFLFLCPMTVGYFAAKGYLDGGSINLFLLCAGVFSFGLGSMIAGFILPSQGPNAVVTVHNVSVLLAGLFHTFGAALAFVGLQPGKNISQRKSKLVFAFVAISVFLAILSFGVMKGFWPIFFIQGKGPTLLRQVILGSGTFFFFIAGSLFLNFYRIHHSKFLYWYSTALFLITIGLICIFFQHSFGSPIGWLGRTAQYMGGVYLVVAIFQGSKEFKTNIFRFDKVLANYFRGRFELLVEERTAQLESANKQLQNEILERNQVEMALLESQKLYYNLVEDTSDLITRVDAEGRFLFLNHTSLEIYGLPAKECIGRLAFDFIHPEDRSATIDAFNEWLKSDEDDLTYENRQMGNNGQVYFMEWATHAEHDENGRVIGFTGTARNITKRKRAEKALQESEDRYRRLVENAPDIVYMFSNQRGGIYYSPRVEQVLGYSAEHLYTHPMLWNESIHPEDRPHISKIISDLEVGKSFETEYRIQDAQGNWHWLQDRSIGREVDGGEVLIEGLATDITERKQAEEALKRSKILLNETEKVGKVGGWKFDIDTEKQTWTEEVYRIHELDFTFDPTVEKGVNFYTPFSRSIIEKAVQRAIEHGEPFDLELEIITAKDNLRSVHVIGNADKENRRIYGFIQDITERKRAEEERESFQKELLKAQKMESIGTLAGGIAHDFNNLLYVVMGNISLAQDDLNLDSGTSESLKEAEQACIKAKELSARLITFSKGGNPVKKMMPINGLLKDMVVSVLSGSNITPKISIADTVRNANIDESQIKQVVRNIVVNAKEAMNDNGQLTVSCENVDIVEKDYHTLSQGEYIKISFKDKGCGILKENLEKIFDPYFSTKDIGDDKGQGLGLTVSYSIIQKHGGLITVESELGAGSTFSVYLQAFLVKEPDLQKSEEKPAAQKAVKKSAKGTGKILLMDDEKAIRNFLGKVINRLGYDVETCIEGKEAIEIYKKAMESKEPFDVVILDLTNKIGMGGQATMKRLLEINPDVKGLIITGYSDDPAVANFRAYGFSGFIIKPATKDELSTVIKEVLSKDQ